MGSVFNRTNFKEALGRDEIGRTGVYVLVGSSEDNALPIVYVGEGDPVQERLKSHYGRKDFWDWAIFFVTKDNSLNKAHVKRMEYRLLQLAKEAKQCKLDNANFPSAPTLSEADTADVDCFLLDMLSIFPLVGLGIFEKAEGRVDSQDVLYLRSKGVTASGYEDAKGFVVKGGSELVMEEAPTITHHYMSTLRKDLLEAGVIVRLDDRFRFTQDHVFGSPSTAAGVVLGRTANGRIEWKTQDGTTLKDLQTQEATSEEATES